MMSNEYIYYGYEIREDVYGCDIYLNGDWVGHADDLALAKVFIDDEREVEGDE